jgi:hypothetical protein
VEASCRDLRCLHRAVPVADRATGSHEFNYLLINLVLGALAAGCIRFAIL